MGIFGNNDERQVLRNPVNTGIIFSKPFNSVVAVDKINAETKNVFPGVSSGILIGPNHALTAGHSAFNAFGGALRVARGETVAGLQTRTRRALNTTLFNTIGISFPAGYNGTKNLAIDIGLLGLEQPLGQSRSLGILAFTAPFTDSTNANFLSQNVTSAFTISTAGYPAVAENKDINFNDPVASRSKNAEFLLTDGKPFFEGGTPNRRSNRLEGLSFRTDAIQLFSTNGNILSTDQQGRIPLSQEIDVEGGQSGSGLWTTLDGDEPRVFGILAGGEIGIPFPFGAPITTDVYNRIVEEMEPTTEGLDPNQLPENAIIGSNSKDKIIGSYRRERIFGLDDNDQLFGGGADDRLEGGKGVDQALFSDVFTNYDLKVDDSDIPRFLVEHTGGTQNDGKDTTEGIEFAVFEFVDGIDDDNLFFVPLQVDEEKKNKIKDGPEVTFSEDIIGNENSSTLGTVSVESPVWMFDGDVHYTLKIGNQGPFNFAYIIDSSGSMGRIDPGVQGTRLEQAQAAYQELTNFLNNQQVNEKESLADQSIFGIIDFDEEAKLSAPLEAPQANSIINELMADGGTNFSAALTEAVNFYNLPSLIKNGTNIAYFLSDGMSNAGGPFQDEAAALQGLAEVRAFGIGDADLDQLNIVDSNTAVLLGDSSGLVTEFMQAPIDKNFISNIVVKLGEEEIETIEPDQLVEEPLALTYEGKIEGLDVSREVENEITFEVNFSIEAMVIENFPSSTSLGYKITTGQEQITQQTKNGTEERIIFEVNQNDFLLSAPSQANAQQLVANDESSQPNVRQLVANNESGQSIPRQIIANDLDNVIEVQTGENTIFGFGGNDRFILLGGINLVDGGDDIDTVQINKTQAEAGDVSKIGNVVNIGSNNSLLNIEFIEFTNARLAVETLAVTPIISLVDQAISVTEGDNGSTFATFTINLSSIAPEDVLINFATRSNNAEAGIDFIANAGQLTIPAGNSSGEIAVEILGDDDFEGDETVLIDLEAISGATFANGITTETAEVNIVNDETVISIPFDGIPTTVVEADPDETSSLQFLINRIGNLNESDTIEVELAPGDSNPAQESDFVNGFTPIQVTFAPGESEQIVDIPIVADQLIEEDETFGVSLTSISGSSLVPTEEALFTILDDDSLLNVDLAIDKINQGAAAVAGQNFTYEIEITNDGPGESEGWEILDILPEGMSFVSATNDDITTVDNLDGTVIFFSDTNIPAGETRSFDVTVLLDPNLAPGTTLLNEVLILGQERDLNPDNNEDIEATSIVAEADLSIDKINKADKAFIGQNFTYEIEITNDGPVESEGWEVIDTLPEGMSFVSATNGDITTVDNLDGTVTFSSDTNIPVGETRSFNVTVFIEPDVVQGTTLLNQVDIVGQNPDSNPDNNQDLEATPITAFADLTINKIDKEAKAFTGQNFTYEIEITNNGPGISEGWSVIDTLPEGMSFVSATNGDIFAVDSPNGTVTFFSGTDIPIGGTRSFDVTVFVEPDVLPGIDLSNQVEVFGQNPDSNPTNNQDIEETRTLTGVLNSRGGLNINTSGLVDSNNHPLGINLSIEEWYQNNVVYNSDATDILETGDGNDIVNAGNGHNFVNGEAGNDIILSGDSGDDLIGGKGSDVLKGGPGLDGFIIKGDPNEGAFGPDSDLHFDANGKLLIDAIIDFNPHEGDFVELYDMRLEGGSSVSYHADSGNLTLTDNSSGDSFAIANLPRNLDLRVVDQGGGNWTVV